MNVNELILDRLDKIDNRLGKIEDSVNDHNTRLSLIEQRLKIYDVNRKLIFGAFLSALAALFVSWWR
jgi:hypothetical protein